MAVKEVMIIELPNGETWCSFISKKESEGVVLKKAPINPEEVELTWVYFIESIQEKIRSVQTKWESETGFFPSNSRWVSGIRNIKRELGTKN